MNGRPALIITHTDAARSNPAWVEFDRSSIASNLVSDGYDTNTLLKAADSTP